MDMIVAVPLAARFSLSHGVTEVTAAAPTSVKLRGSYPLTHHLFEAHDSCTLV
jgi:hypothetical protein